MKPARGLPEVVIRIGDSGGIQLMEEKAPGAGDVVLFGPLGQAPLAQPSDPHHFGPAAHRFDHFACVHDASLDLSKHNVKNLLDHRLENSCSNPRMDKRADKYANRRARLLRLIDEKAQGNKAEFGRMYGYTRAQIGQYISPTYNDGRSPGEGVIEKLEDRAGLPPGWFDLPLDGSSGWPFPSVSEDKVRALTPQQITQLEAAILIAAAQVGLDVKK